VPGEFRGKVPDAVAQRRRVGVVEFRVVLVAEEAGPGGEVGGDVRREHPPLVDLEYLRRQAPEPMSLAVRTPTVSTQACSRCSTSMYCG